ncbi:MAG: tetratricopeptide repeat protein [Candidatus Eisenbacteria bacterium]|nr:tetratricopeptide repeat protein [Candidatus Eisenbacteria bacterium]
MFHSPKRPAFRMTLLFLVALAAMLAASAHAGDPVTQDWSGIMPAVALVDVQGPGGAPLRQTYGTFLGDPGRLVVRLSALKGAERLEIALRGGGSLTASDLIASDAANDIAVLDAKGLIPVRPVADQTMYWRFSERIRVIPGPGMPDAMPELTCGEPMEVGALRIVPVAGEHPEGLLVMHHCGRWVGITGKITDPTGSFHYMTTKESILPLLQKTASPTPIAGIEIGTSDWLNPATAKGLLVRAFLTSYENPTAAQPFFDLASARDKEMPEIRFWAGKALFKEAKYPEAEAAFREAARLRPRWEHAYFMGGASAFQQKNYDVAVQIYDEGLKSIPKSAMIMSNKAAALGGLGRVQEAVDVLKAAIEANPTYGMAVFNLGGLYLQMGKRIDAEEQYTKLLEIDKGLADGLRKMLDSK